MELLIRQLAIASSCTAGRLFVQECEIEELVESADFCLELIRLFAIDLTAAKHLLATKKQKIVEVCRSWGQNTVQIFWSTDFYPFSISANLDREPIGEIMPSNQPLIATPSVEIGSLTLSRQVLDRIIFLIENPKTKGALVRCHDEAQVAMSQASAALIIGATTKQAVQRKRAEYWHPLDLIQSRIKISEQVKDLRQGIIKPIDTKHELSWRGVSADGRNWRRFTHVYETFVDEMGIAYQFAINEAVVQIDPPTDLVLA